MIRIHSWPWLGLGLMLMGFVAFSFVNFHFVEVVGGQATHILHVMGFILAAPMGFALQRATRFWEAVLGYDRR